VAEAPGRLGADATGVPLFGDQTGDNFEFLLESIGWRRDDIFVTNAVLCNPREERGVNSTPTVDEVLNCSQYLEMTIELANPDVIVTLGAVALTGLKNIRSHNYILKKHVGQALPWNRRALVPLYHPSPRVRVHRPMEQQLADFRRLAQLVSPTRGLLQRPFDSKADEYSDRFQQLVHVLVHSLGPMSYFKLTKLMYLVDLNSLSALGRTLTNQIYLRQQEGPWPPVLPKMLKPLDGREILISRKRGQPIVEPGPSPRIGFDFRDDELEVIADVMERYREFDDSDMKVAVYRTPPMRYVRGQEKEGRKMLNVPVIYQNQTIAEREAGGRSVDPEVRNPRLP
jgi:uracil-DNA glycosylase family 4